MRQTLPAKAVDKLPQYQFAVISVRQGEPIASLESSFMDRNKAEGLFERIYSKWGLTDTNFYLVDWRAQTVLATHEVWSS